MLAVALASLAAGCGSPTDSSNGGVNLEPPVNLQLLVSSGRISERFNRANLRKVVQSAVNDFSGSNPRIYLHLRFAPEEEVLSVVRKRSDLGAGPDLILSRESVALQMDRENLTEPSGLTGRDLAPFNILNLGDFRQKDGYASLPLLLQPNLPATTASRSSRRPPRWRSCCDARRRGTSSAFRWCLTRSAGPVRALTPRIRC